LLNLTQKPLRLEVIFSSRLCCYPYKTGSLMNLTHERTLERSGCPIGRLGVVHSDLKRCPLNVLEEG